MFPSPFNPISSQNSTVPINSSSEQPQNLFQRSPLVQEGPTVSFSFDTPELVPVRTTNEDFSSGMTPRSVMTPQTLVSDMIRSFREIETGTPRSDATPRSATGFGGQSNNCNLPLFVPDLSPRSLVSGMANNNTSVGGSFSSSHGMNPEDLDLVNSVSDQELELLLALLAQQTPVQQQNMQGYQTGGGMQMNARVGMGAYASYIEPQVIPEVNDKYKTEICKLWEKEGVCRFGARCHFAHGVQEVRNAPKHPNYKTKLCRNYSQTGRCQYGQRCQFIHQIVFNDSRQYVQPVPNIPDINQLPQDLTQQDLVHMLSQQVLSSLDQ